MRDYSQEYAVPSEVDQPRLAEIYTRTAAFYDEVVAQHQARAKEIAIEMLGWQPGVRLLEVGTGTGWLLERLLKARVADLVTGIDVSEGMLEVARLRLRATGASVPGLMLADATRLPFRDETFDCLLCTYTLEVLPAKIIPRALAEMRRVLKRGERLVVADLTEGEGDDASFVEDWRQRYEADPDYFGGARPVVLSPLLEAAGCDLLERRYSGHGAGWPSEILLARPSG
jgi:ubiquinone/menaquinone biosynthesis C-methylase UbiE